MSIRYKQSILGVFWAFLQPLSMMLLFTFVFSVIMPTQITEYPYPVFFYTGLTVWNLFAGALHSAIPSLVGNYNLITKIYFPREIIPLSGIFLALADFVIASIFLVPMLFLFGVMPTWNALWFFPLALILFLFTTSVCLVFSALNVYYRDVNLLMNFLIQLWFFATPVIYTIDKAPMRLKLFLFCNPMTFIVENIRRCLLEGRAVVWWQYCIMLFFVLLIFVASYSFFKITEKRFADVI